MMILIQVNNEAANLKNNDFIIFKIINLCNLQVVQTDKLQVMAFVETLT